MKSEDLLRALSDVDPKLLLECDRVRSRGHRSRGRSAVLILVAASILLAGVSAVYFSVKVRQSDVGASVASDEVETRILETEETAEISETEEPAQDPEASTSPAEFVIYEGISEIDIHILKNFENEAYCSCSISCKPGYSGSAVLLMPHSAAGEKKSVIGQKKTDLSGTWQIIHAGTYQACVLVTVYDSEGRIVNKFARFSESVMFQGLESY